ncbi:MAG: FtsW/RodA/SpoVE family cell cycle protein [Mycobacterium leprae]
MGSTHPRGGRGSADPKVRQLRPDRMAPGHGRDPDMADEQPLPLEQQGVDWLYITALVLLVSVGMIMVYSTTAVDGGFAGLSKLLKLMLLVGLPMLAAGIFLPQRFWRKASPWILFGAFAALVSLFVPHNPLVHAVKGAKRWIFLPGGYQIQPSEFAKLAFILFAAKFLERRGQRMKSDDWFVFLGVLGTFAGAIYFEPDLGTALVLGATAVFMLIASGVKWGPILKLGLVAVAVVALLAFNTSHQASRLKAWWNPWEDPVEKGYQVTQGWIAMARGGWWGVGLGRSTQKLGHLPEAGTDFIFAIVGEELGLVRAAGVLWLFGILAWRGYRIAARAPDRYNSLLVTGVTSWISVQACLNIAVVTGTVPNTGVPLPFISSGISALTALMLGTGMVIGVSRSSHKG